MSLTRTPGARRLGRTIRLVAALCFLLAFLVLVMSWPETPLGHKCEAAPGADLTADPSTYTWRDLTGDVSFAGDHPITLSRGTEDEQPGGQSGLDFTLRDDQGRYNPDNPESDLYPDWDLNCPVRWTVGTGGAAPAVRQVGYLSEIDQDWPAGSSAKCFTHVVAAGLFQRMGAGSAGRVKSPLRRAYLSARQAQPVAYWPMEGASGTVASVGSGLQGGTPLTTLTSVAGVDQSPDSPGTDGMIDPSGGTLQAKVTGVSSTAWQMEVVTEFPTSTIGLNGGVVLLANASGGTYPQWGISTFWDTSGATPVQNWGFFWRDSISWTTLDGSGTTHAGPHHIVGRAVQNGANVDVAIIIDGVTQNSFSLPMTLGSLSTFVVNPDGIAPPEIPYVCHAAIYNGGTNDPTIDRSGARNGYTGEAAHTRVARLAAQESFPASVTASRSTLMGPQPIASLLDCLRDTESTDRGILDDSQGVVGYRSVTELYNQDPQLVIDGNMHELVVPFNPTRDDQKIKNSVLAIGSAGEATYKDTDSIAQVGTYDTEIEANVATADQLLGQASWVVHEGTAPGRRVPGLELNLRVAPGLVGAWLGAALGDRIQIVNPPRQFGHGPADLILRGFVDTFTGRGRWDVASTVTPYSPYEVYVVETGTGNRSRIDSNDSTLTADVTSSAATSLSVTVAGTLWVTGAVSFDIEVAGERMTVSNIAGAVSPQTFTVTRSVNGVRKLHVTGSKVRLWRPGVLAL